MEALLFAAGAVSRQGGPGATVGDASPEARARGQSVELNVSSFSFMGDSYGVIDAPGAVDFSADAACALPAVDLVLVVTDPQPERAVLLQPVMKALERHGVPHALFVNKVDQAHGAARDLARGASSRQHPTAGHAAAADGLGRPGHRLCRSRPGASLRLPPGRRVRADRSAGRNRPSSKPTNASHMLEQLADYDDHLMEELLSDVAPPRDEVFADLVRETGEGLIVPVFFGSAQNGFGIRRLLKALRHDTPSPEAAAARLGAKGDAAYVFKTAHAGQAGKLAYARVLNGRSTTAPS